MYKSLIMLLVLLLVLPACASRQGRRKPMLRMNVHEMFPEDIKAQALATAAEHGDIKRMDKLVAQGANVNAVGEYGVTLPYWLLLHPNKDGFKRLLQLGADPNIIWVDPKTQYENSLLHETVKKAPYIGTEYLQMALEIGNGDPNLLCGTFSEPPMRWATFPEYEPAFVLLYNAGADITYVNTFGHSLCNYFAGSNNYKTTYFLLQNSVNYLYKDNNGFNIKIYVERSVRNGLIQRYKKESNPQYMWFWRCVDFLENRGMTFDFQPNIVRPAVLDTADPDFGPNFKNR